MPEYVSRYPDYPDYSRHQGRFENAPQPEANPDRYSGAPPAAAYPSRPPAQPAPTPAPWQSQSGSWHEPEREPVARDRREPPRPAQGAPTRHVPLSPRPVNLARPVNVAPSPEDIAAPRGRTSRAPHVDAFPSPRPISDQRLFREPPPRPRVTPSSAPHGRETPGTPWPRPAAPRKPEPGEPEPRLEPDDWHGDQRVPRVRGPVDRREFPRDTRLDSPTRHGSWPVAPVPRRSSGWFANTHRAGGARASGGRRRGRVVVVFFLLLVLGVVAFVVMNHGHVLGH